MKRFLSILMSAATLLFALFAGGCDSGNEPTEKASLGRSAQLFLQLVGEIGDAVTADSEADIDAALIVYEHLGEADRQNAAVSEAKAALDGFKAEFDAAVAKAKAEAEARLDRQRAQTFCDAVAALPSPGELSLGDRPSLDEAASLYEALSDRVKETEDVLSANKTLSDLLSAMTALEAEEHARIVREKAEAFIGGVGELGEVTSESGFAINSLLDDYDRFDEEVRSYNGVPEAKRELDEKYERYLVLKDEHDIEEFLERAGALKSATLENGAQIKAAQSAFEALSDTAKQDARVQAEFQRLEGLYEDYLRLEAEAEQKRLELFIERAMSVRTDLENIDVTWYEALNVAAEAYAALSSDSKKSLEGSEALQRWSAAQNAFDQKGYRQIPTGQSYLEYSGDAIPFLLIHVFRNIGTTLDFYGVDNINALSQRVDGCLEVYVGGTYVATTTIDMTAIENGFIYKNVVPLLKGLADGHAEIQSGASFSFAFYFRDKNGEFISSKKSDLSEPTNRYTW